MILYSYDIFDTIITRRTGNPYGIFSLVQEKLQRVHDIPDEVKNNFFELRIQAERLARLFYCKDGKEEVTLLQIYQAMNTSGLLNEDIINYLMKLECETELENIIPIPTVVHEIREHIKKKDKIVFILDMYLEKKVIRQMLDSVDKTWRDIPLYVSSEIGKTKTTGNMYQFVYNDLQISFSNWVHTGANRFSDITVPKNLGIKTVQVNKKLLLPIEKSILTNEENSSSVQLLIGIAKNTRLMYRLDGPGAVGASLSGFLLGSYVKWLLHDALRRGIKTLYFIARDGYVLKIIADIFIQSMGYQISTQYLYGSRKAWRVPVLNWETLNFFELLGISYPQFLFDLESIASIFGIPYSKFLEYLPESVKRNSEKLSKLDITILFGYLNSLKEFRQYLVTTHEKNRKLTLEYLKQEIDFQDPQIAFVEIGGTGFTQKCLESMLHDIYHGKIVTYFFQIYTAYEEKEHVFYNFFPDDLYNKDAIEPLSRAPHAQTKGYKKRNNSVEPIFEKEDNSAYYKCHYDQYVEGLIDYAKVYMQHYKDLFDMPVNRRMIKKCWDYYTKVSDQLIWDFVGEVPFEVTGESGGFTYAPKLDEKEIERLFYVYKNEPVTWHYKGASLDMSILRMSDSERRLMEEYRKRDKERKLDIDREFACNMFVRIPKGRYPVGTKIVIYGAGKVGKLFYAQVNDEKNYDVVLWTDKKYLQYEQLGYPVYPPDKILCTEFEIILIAALNEKIQHEIEKDLKQLGIPKEKIDWISYEELLRG